MYTGLAYILPTVRIYFVNNVLRNPYRHNIMIVMHYNSDADVAYTVFTEMYTKISREKKYNKCTSYKK